jgi:hypothetical protein
LGDDRSVVPPDDVSAFGQDIAAELRSILADGFVGAYFVGSIALGGYVTGESDIDIVAVCDQKLNKATRQALVEKLLEVTTTCPARGLEFTLYRIGIASSPRGHRLRGQCQRRSADATIDTPVAARSAALLVRP